RSTVEQVAGDGLKEDVGSDKSGSLTASQEKRMWPSLPSLPLSLEEEMAGASESNPHDATDAGPHRVRWKHAAPHDEPKRTVVAFGDAMFSPTMKGKRAGVSRVVFRTLRHHEHLGHLVLVKVPEFYSSKVCSKCQTLTLEHVRERTDDDQFPGMLCSN